MNDTDVRVVHLEPMRVAVALGFGSSPEVEAWAALLRWARDRSLTVNSDHRYFGFNNPSPSPGSPNYGYEQWMTVGESATPGAGITIRDFPGGDYLVTRCALDRITERWGDLVEWCDDSRYAATDDQCLEECLTPQALSGEDGVKESEAVFDIYLPIAL